MKRFVLTLSLMVASCSLAWGQATTTASRSDFEVGGTFSFALPDYTPQKSVGYGFYTNYFFTPHLGVELDFHRLNILQHSPATETSFDYGLSYRHVYGPFRPYIRASLGRGSFNFPSQTVSNTSVGTQSYNLSAFAGGVDYEVIRDLNVRGEVEYQNWWAANGLTNGLDPFLFTVGVAYHFNPKEPEHQQ